MGLGIYRTILSRVERVLIGVRKISSTVCEAKAGQGQGSMRNWPNDKEKPLWETLERAAGFAEPCAAVLRKEFRMAPKLPLWGTRSTEVRTINKLVCIPTTG